MIEELLQIFTAYPKIITFGCAELVCLLVKQDDIKIAVKNKKQRTKDEQQRAERGLLRSLALELVLFVPSSVILVLLIFPSLLNSMMMKFGASTGSVSYHALLGIISYGFPFATLRSLVTRIALKTLAEFAVIANKKIEGQLDEKGRL